MIKAERIESDRSIECMQFYQHVIADTPDMDQYGRVSDKLNSPLRDRIK